MCSMLSRHSTAQHSEGSTVQRIWAAQPAQHTAQSSTAQLNTAQRNISGTTQVKAAAQHLVAGFSSFILAAVAFECSAVVRSAAVPTTVTEGCHGLELSGAYTPTHPQGSHRSASAGHCAAARQPATVNCNPSPHSTHYTDYQAFC